MIGHIAIRTDLYAGQLKTWIEVRMVGHVADGREPAPPGGVEEHFRSDIWRSVLSTYLQCPGEICLVMHTTLCRTKYFNQVANVLSHPRKSSGDGQLQLGRHAQNSHDELFKDVYHTSKETS